MLHDPVPVSVGVFVSSLEGIAPQVEDLWKPERNKGLCPQQHRLGPLLIEDRFPIPVTDGHDLAVVVGVEKPVTRALVRLTLEIGQHVVAVDLDLEMLVAGLVTPLQLLDDIRFAGRRQ